MRLQQESSMAAVPGSYTAQPMSEPQAFAISGLPRGSPYAAVQSGKQGDPPLPLGNPRAFCLAVCTQGASTLHLAV